MDKATPTLRQRCDTALQSLPDAPYRAMLAALFDEMLAEVERLAAQAAPTEQADLRQLMGMNEAEIDAELIAAGISPDDAVKRADRAIKGALATVRAERRAIEYGDIVHKQVVAMRAAVVAAKLESPEVGIQWIANTLFGPGHYPDIEAARELGGAQALFDKEMAEHEAFRAAHPAPVAAQPSQAPVVQAMKATSEPLQRYTLRRPKDAADYMAKDSDGQWVKYDDLKADRASSGATTPAAPFAKDSWQHAVDNQLVAFGRTSQEFANPHEALAWLAIMNMELGQSNAGATTQAVRMLTEDEQAAIIDMHSTGRAQGDHECAEAIQRKFCEVNKLRIPADGVIGVCDAKHDIILTGSSRTDGISSSARPPARNSTPAPRRKAAAQVGGRILGSAVAGNQGLERCSRGQESGQARAQTNKGCPIMTTDTDKLEEMLRASGAEEAVKGLFYVTAEKAAAYRAAIIADLCGDVEPVAEFGGRRQTPEGTTEFWGVLLEPWDAPPKGSQLYSASTVAALKAERDAALARVAELEKDAARYQKLLDLWNGRDMRELFGIEDFAALDAAPQPQQEQP